MSVIEELKQKLLEGKTLAVHFDSGERFFSDGKGIGDLLKLSLTEGALRNAVAADKIVGRAASFLYCRAGVKYLYAETLSEGGAKILTEHGIEFSYKTLTPAIMNRAGTGICPMDSAVKDTEDIDTAYGLIRKRLAELRSMQQNKN